MRRIRVAACAALLVTLASGAALAANPNWVQIDDATKVCPANLQPGIPCSFQWDANSNANSTFVQLGGLPFSLRLEPHKEGSGTAATADVYACTTDDGNGDGTKDTTACTAWQWDTDADGIVDDNTLDASDPMKIGTPVFRGGVPFLYIDPTANPVSGTAEVIITGGSLR